MYLYASQMSDVFTLRIFPQKSEQKQTKLRQQNSLQLNSVPTPAAAVIPRSDSSIIIVNSGKCSDLECLGNDISIDV